MWVWVVGAAKMGNMQIYACQLDSGDHVELMFRASTNDIEVVERELVFWNDDLLSEETKNCGLLANGS